MLGLWVIARLVTQTIIFAWTGWVTADYFERWNYSEWAYTLALLILLLWMVSCVAVDLGKWE
jgi:hypothetical protein